MFLLNGALLAPAFLLLGAPAPVPDKEAEAKQTKADCAAFQDYLKANKLNGSWQGDPTRLDSEDIRKAYPGRRIYFTYEAPPLPPGAFLPELIKAHQQRVAEYQKHSLKITVQMDGDKVISMSQPAGFNAGLMEIKSDDEARVAAAAILSMNNADHVPPGVVSAKDVTVSSNDKGWTCNFSKPMRFNGEVKFDSKGQVVAVSKKANWIMPLPPSARPGGLIPPKPPGQE
jgi:hypothetical protein